MINFFGKTQATQTDTSKNSVPVLPQDLYADAGLNLADIIAPSAVKVESKQLILGEKFVRSFFITSYPSVVSDNWLSPLINLDKVFDIAIYIHPVDTAAIMKKFEKKVAEVQSQINVRESKGFVRDPMLESAYRDLEELRDRLQQAQEKMFDVGLYLSLYADTEEGLGHAEAEIKSMLESRLIYVRPALFQQEEAFQSIIPVNEDKIVVTKKINSEPLSSFFPFVSFDLTSDKGILYGINRHNSSLVLFDRFSLENYNSVTFAKSGSGKSFATKLEILRSLMFDVDVIVIDPEREYESMAEAVGGRYFNISLNSKHHINPFDLPVPREDESPADVLRANIISLVGLFRLMLSGLTPEEDSIVDRAIAETYALKDITPDSDFSAIEPPLLSDFEMVLSGMEGAESILTKLTKYTRGSWAGFINQPSNVDINRKFIVFSVRDMEDDLKPVAMYLVTHFIWNAVRRTLRKRLLVVDEAWWMMKSDDTAAFLYALAKRGRKYYLGISTITQDVTDFLKSPYGLPIMTNSSIQILLKQSPTSIDAVQKAFNLTDEEKFLLLESGVGEGIFFAGMKHVAIRTIASYTEEQIITSDPSQILAIKKAKRELAEAEAKTGL
ncbi:MAG: Type IV secretory pathway VirB4 component-like protein [Parcubacteria group bacterium GW2011_GWC1_42_11]|uniref:Type IV secretory pathway VirB4 component-like protein n=1 Tax=Candidatus Nomurabacteria bacterium GW2011_GWC2_42_20 TaxID=1618756 RepID=A0A0G0ZHV2_9BACT|nr:MAG: Type IV secretory pathway VirB4 component-like protein [Parcubacteria group bacterium GW2011_GWC1_42_11]KKS48254.1 MAG: Type IV secretory pathway VirB4 component-like protein [Candidatus Nomurabacteria bacterium GW2011_GWC2_42_20]KKS58828.1 MAG: Type IV secretory pathway VirB4 component-like protein [Candidatus Nomurabacteria bacterium GW2011_GWA2_42_41]KKT09827.1 MAG: Type IV secretory pathway VirB4 component-like protein [Candidatus Nomurabacteria bacterium GW2011_GWB1_43_20]TAN36290.